MFRLYLPPILLLCLLCAAGAQTQPRVLRVAVLDFGSSQTGKQIADLLTRRLNGSDIEIVDRDLAHTAARGIGYSGSLNLSRPDARDLGAALGCDFYLVGDAQTVRRNSSKDESYFEAYVSLFLVSARTGNLITWFRPTFQAPTDIAAMKLLNAELSGFEVGHRLTIAMRRAEEDERQLRTASLSSETVIEEAPDDEKAAEANGLRLPRPFRRLKPSYTDDAARAEAEATVDVLVDVDEKGEVRHAEIERWAGFGLDQASLETVKQLHFFPAMREGTPIAMRVLLRYNFRKPVKTS